MPTKANKEQASLHTKAQLLASRRYAGRRDIISTLLEDSKTYTTAQVDEMMDIFMKGKVK